MSHIYVAGSINMDISINVNERPRLGETIVGNDVEFGLGGKGANQAIAAARLGTPVRMIGRVGNDAFGEDLLSHLEEEDNLELNHVHQIESRPSGMAFITVDSNSENSIIIIPGSNNTITSSDLQDISIESDAIAVSQFEIPQKVIFEFFKIAQANNATTILNPAPAKEFKESILPLVDYLVMNETETIFYSESEHELPLSEEALVEACSELRKHEGQTIIVTLGEEGLFASTPTETISLDSYSVNAVDTTGAGDAFVGALATAIANDMNLRDALKFANATGAVATTSSGASSSLPTRTEVRTLLSEN